MGDLKKTVKPVFIYFIAASAITLFAQALMENTLDLKSKYFPDVSIVNSEYAVAVGKDHGKNIYRFVPTKPHSWRSISEISRLAIRAILVSEDGNFYSHKGYEPELIRKAWLENVRSHRYKRGASTISQQVAKNLFLGPQKTLSRKLRELYLTLELEHAVSKQRILETYLNIAEWGPGIYGIEQAAQKYFHVSAKNLTARQGAILAFLLPSPTRLSRSIQNGVLSSFAQSRVNDIMSKLWMQGQISAEEYSGEYTEENRGTQPDDSSTNEH